MPPSTCISDVQYLDRLGSRAVRSRIPLSGGIALTHRCNLNCVHCYLGAGSRGPSRAELMRRELPTARVLGILDEIVDAGCLFLLLTGGEPLLRRDFRKIYTHAREKGLVPTVFTNGTLVDADTAAMFRDLPPRGVEVTLYGATARTYEKITQVRGSFSRCLRGIDRLLAGNVRLRLKTIVMTPNQSEFAAIRSMAAAWGVPFRFDVAVSARLNGDRAPLRYRLPAAQAADIEFSDAQAGADWKKLLRRARTWPKATALYSCGAGVASFYIDAEGSLQPCLMTTHVQYGLRRGRFIQGWENVIPSIRRFKVGLASKCLSCVRKPVCGYCPPFSALETGHADQPCDFLCMLGKERLERIRKTHAKK